MRRELITTESTVEQTVITQENGRIQGQTTGQNELNIRCKLLQNILYWSTIMIRLW